MGLGLSGESGKYNGLGLFFKEELSDTPLRTMMWSRQNGNNTHDFYGLIL